MKMIKHLTFGALAVLAVTLLFQTPIARADAQGQRGGGANRNAQVTFRKWVVDYPPCPGVLGNMAGVVGGDVGAGTFTGEVLQDSIVGSLEKVEALYHFHGPKHAFTALVHVEQTGATTGSKAVIIGVVIEGWLKGHAVKGEYTQIECDHVGVDAFCYEGSLEIDRDSKQ